METAHATPTGPTQGYWTEPEFLALPDPHRFELSQGQLEVLAMPTWLHASIAFFLARLLDDFVRPRGLGLAAPAPLYVRLWEGEIRQPDVVFCFHENIHDRRKIQNGADLAMEVVSEGKDNRDRDIVLKRSLYARAGIREYWIVDPLEQLISVLTLVGEEYQTAGEYKPGENAVSLLLPGFTVDVQAVFANAEQ